MAFESKASSSGIPSSGVLARVASQTVSTSTENHRSLYVDRGSALNAYPQPLSCEYAFNSNATSPTSPWLDPGKLLELAHPPALLHSLPFEDAHWMSPQRQLFHRATSWLCCEVAVLP